MRWLHRACEGREYALLHERDRLEGTLVRLQKQHADLQGAYESLVAEVTTRGQHDTFSRMVNEMFEEAPVPEGREAFLTPALEEREGLVEAPHRTPNG